MGWWLDVREGKQATFFGINVRLIDLPSLWGLPLSFSGSFPGIQLLSFWSPHLFYFQHSQSTFFEALFCCELVFPSPLNIGKLERVQYCGIPFHQGIPWESSFIMRILEGIIVVSLPLFFRVMRLFFSDFLCESLVQSLEGIVTLKSFLLQCTLSWQQLLSLIASRCFCLSRNGDNCLPCAPSFLMVLRKFTFTTWTWNQETCN